MGKLFLASSINNIASMISRELKGGQKGKKVLFITTASEVEEGDRQWLEKDKKALKNIGLETIDYTIAGKSKNDFVKDFKDIHYVFVSGGNTFYLLEKAQQSGFINFINDYMQKDNVYFGSSAGAAIAGPDIYPLLRVDSPEKAPNLKGYQGFGLIDIVILPHWGSEDFKELYLNHRLEQAYGDKYKLVLLTDYQFISVDNEGSYKILDIK
jgi:dipeptidase E